jgi:hypothetical protein
MPLTLSPSPSNIDVTTGVWGVGAATASSTLLSEKQHSEGSILAKSGSSSVIRPSWPSPNGCWCTLCAAPALLLVLLPGKLLPALLRLLLFPAKLLLPSLLQHCRVPHPAAVSGNSASWPVNMPLKLLLAPLVLPEALLGAPSSKLGVLWCRGGVEGWLSLLFGDISSSNEATSKGKDPNDKLLTELVMLALLVAQHKIDATCRTACGPVPSRQGSLLQSYVMKLLCQMP